MLLTSGAQNVLDCMRWYQKLYVQYLTNFTSNTTCRHDMHSLYFPLQIIFHKFQLSFEHPYTGPAIQVHLHCPQPNNFLQIHSNTYIFSSTTFISVRQLKNSQWPWWLVSLSFSPIECSTHKLALVVLKLSVILKSAPMITNERKIEIWFFFIWGRY